MNIKQTIFITVGSIIALLGIVYAGYHVYIDMMNPYSFFQVIDVFLLAFMTMGIIFLGIIIYGGIMELLT